jgi:hypothetical protein
VADILWKKASHTLICQNIGGCLIKYMTKRITFTTKLSIAQGG